MASISSKESIFVEVSSVDPIPVRAHRRLLSIKSYHTVVEPAECFPAVRRLRRDTQVHDLPWLIFSGDTTHVAS